MPTSSDRFGDLFVTALQAIGVTLTPTYINSADFSLRKGLIYRASPTVPSVKLDVILNSDDLDNHAGSTERFYGELFGRVIKAIGELPPAPETSELTTPDHVG